MMVLRNKQVAQSVFIETLEARRLLSASPSVGWAELQGGDLKVTGTKGDDVILVSMNYSDPVATKLDVTVNDSVIGRFVLSDVTGSVEVRAGKGDDLVRFDESTGLIPLRLIAYGENGDDTLVGSYLDDELHGGNGDDTLYGNDGFDALFGDNGKDLLVGGSGDDELDGGNCTDVLYGEAGLDTLLGGNGKDALDGGDDADTLDGGRGFDDLTGGSGADTFAGSEKSVEIHDKTDEDLYVRIKFRGGDEPELEHGKGHK